MTLMEQILKYFPDATKVSVWSGECGPAAAWLANDMEYAISYSKDAVEEDGEEFGWYCSWFDTDEDWGLWSSTSEDAISKASTNEWTEHGRVIADMTPYFSLLKRDQDAGSSSA